MAEARLTHEPARTAVRSAPGVLATALAALAPSPADPRVDAFSEGVPASLAPAFAECAPLRGIRREWCAVQATSVSVATATEVMAMCALLREDGPRDVCLEMAARNPAGGPLLHACDAMSDGLLRSSCRLYLAESRMRGHLDDAIDACRETGPLVRHCVIHIAQIRTDHWIQSGIEAAGGETSVLLAAFPQFRADADVGTAFGIALAAAGARPGIPGPCDLFDAGRGRDECRRKVHGRYPPPPPGALQPGAPP